MLTLENHLTLLFLMEPHTHMKRWLNLNLDWESESRHQFSPSPSLFGIIICVPTTSDGRDQSHRRDETGTTLLPKRRRDRLGLSRTIIAQDIDRTEPNHGTRVLTKNQNNKRTKPIPRTMKFTNAVVALSSTLFLASTLVVDAGSEWARLGQPLCPGEDEGGFESMDMADLGNGDDSFVMAVGSPRFTDEHFRQGRVQFHRFSPGRCLWESNSFASPLMGQRSEDRFGSRVALSCNGERVAAAGDLENGEDRQGFVQVFTRSGGGWRQIGQTLDDRQTLNQPVTETNFGRVIELNCEGDLLKVESNGGIHMYTYSQGADTWTLSRFFADKSAVNDLARGTAVLAVREGPYGSSVSADFVPAHIAVYELRSDGNWALLGNNNITLPDETTPQGVSISDDGSRVAVSDSGLEFVYELSDSNRWGRVETNAFLSGTSLRFSGDGETLFGVDFDELYAYREYTVKNTPEDIEDGSPPEEREWLRVGGDIELSTGDSFLGGSISQTGSVVALASSQRIEAYFYPDDTSIVSRDGLDCYPDMDLPEARSCSPDDDDDEEEVTRIEGEIDLDDIGAGAAAGIAFGAVAFCLACCALGLFVWMRQMMGSKGTRGAEENANVPPNTKQLDEELKPLSHPKDMTHDTGSGEIPTPVHVHDEERAVPIYQPPTDERSDDSMDL